MKVQFSKEVRFVPTWRDNDKLPANEQLMVWLEPMKMGVLLDVLDTLKQVGFERGESTSLSPEQMRGVVQAAGKYIPVSVKKIEGADGFDINDIVQYAEFFGLAVEMVFELVRISSPSQADAKN